MALHREDYESWIRDTIEPRDPELVQPIRNALDAFGKIQSDGRVDAELLAPIVEAAESHRRPMYEMAAGLLQSLTAEHAEARESVTRMASDKKSQVRFNAVICLGSDTPRDYSVGLVRQALADKSAKVRQKAADWAQRLRMTEIVVDLERALATESNTATKQTIEFSLPLLRDGYIIEDEGDDELSITIPHDRGITGLRMSREELAQKGISAVIAEVQEGRR
ncbi:MAG: hypothetical protein AAGF31_13685 [Planctomycetota bacterium]